MITKLNSTFDYDAVLIALTGSMEPHFGANVWKSSGHLHMWYPSQEAPATEWEKEIDNIFEKGVSELDLKKRKKLYDRWQKIVSDQVPMIYTVLPAALYAIHNKFGNTYPTPVGEMFHNIERMFVKKMD
ncbi:MAG: hypothetical protein HYS98_03030 [Deltaproteobacteria bacterium]|nr:hypothetical protein [Deltaproteobacteria bacterium]